MLNNIQSFVIVFITVMMSVVFMVGLNRLWEREKRRSHNDLIGWQFSILGTTYAVILGFMLYTVWTDFGSADLNADAEANALVNVYRLAEGLPQQQRVQLETLTNRYAAVVIDKEWPEMAQNKIPHESQEISADMWKTLMSVKAASPTETTAEDHAITELSSLTSHRRTRILQSAARLPAILWCVLIIGGSVTVASASMFGSANVSLHAIQVIAFSLLISLVMVAIADINRPFQGSVRVTSYSFLRAQQDMSDHEGSR